MKKRKYKVPKIVTDTFTPILGVDEAEKVEWENANKEELIYCGVAGGHAKVVISKGKSTMGIIWWRWGCNLSLYDLKGLWYNGRWFMMIQQPSKSQIELMCKV